MSGYPSVPSLAGSYLFNLYGKDQHNIKRWLSGEMVKDLTKTINSLRCIAVERCRERLDHAARKANDLIGNGQPVEQKEKPQSGEEHYGVTSLMKRRHGL